MNESTNIRNPMNIVSFTLIELIERILVKIAIEVRNANNNI